MPSQRHLYLAAITACLTAALFGYSVGFIGGLLVLPSFLHHFALDHLSPSGLASAQSRTVTVWLLGCVFGVPLGMPVCSRYGRKRCLIFSASLYVAGAAMQLGSGVEWVFDLGRALNGLGVGAGTLVSPMYISEVSPPSERGMLMSGYQTVLQIAALIGFWGAFTTNSLFPDSSPLQWQIPVAIQLVPGALLLLGTLFIPETPRYLAEKGKYGAAEESLAWLRDLQHGDAELATELNEIREAAELGNSRALMGKHTSFWREASKKGVRNRLGVGIGLMIAQNMVGLNALNYYAPVIFMSAGFTSVSSSLFLTGIFGLVKLVSAVSFMFLFVRLRGNRFWLKLGSLVCGIAMLILAYYVRILPPPSQTDPESGLTVGGVISICMVYIFAFFFGVSLGPISWNVCSEIFPLRINAKCCAITTCTQWLFQIVIASITPNLLATVGWATYVLYAVCCIISVIWCHFFVPETRGVALGRPMDELFGEKDATDEEDALEEAEEVGEITPLLREREHRRSSIVVYSS